MKKIAVIFTALLALCIAAMPVQSREAAKNALILCSDVLIPSIFPFLVCSNILVSLGAADKISKYAGKITRPLFSVGGSGALPIVLGFLSGYPCGAATVCSLYKNGSLTKNEANRLLAFSNNSGPLFIISAVGLGIFSSTSAGVILYVSHVLGAILCGIIFSFFAKKQESGTQQFAASAINSENSISRAAESMLSLCGTVVFFSVVLSILRQSGVISFLTSFLCRLGLSTENAELFSCGLFEITTALFSSASKSIPCAAAVISFGGIYKRRAPLSFLLHLGQAFVCGFIRAVRIYSAYFLPCFALFVFRYYFRKDLHVFGLFGLCVDFISYCAQPLKIILPSSYFMRSPL